jgi:hypothetical protein
MNPSVNTIDDVLIARQDEKMVDPMNARAAQRLTSVKKGNYTCQKCQAQFKFEEGDLKCPSCGTTAADNLVPYYTENDPERDEMLTRDDFASGD